MKQRITLSIDPSVTVRAKQLAYARNTTVSGLIERLFKTTPLSEKKKGLSFVSRWAGWFIPARSRAGDARMRLLKRRFRLK